MKRIFKRVIAVTVVTSIICTMTACREKSKEIRAKDLMQGVEVQKLDDEIKEVDVGKSELITDFAVRLFQASINHEKDEKNLLVSPLSVMYALAITANGAKDTTLNEMETVLGMEIGQLNQYLKNYNDNLPQDEHYKLKLANSVWFTDHPRFEVNRDFLKTNGLWYNASIYKAPFDETTCDDINLWVNEKTDGMISDILDEIPEAAVMYLVNALAFDAEWSSKYKKSEVREGVFTSEDGTDYTVDFMHSEEMNYFEDEIATGFMKYYKGGKYAFVALLPKEDVGLNEYIDSLTGAHITKLLENPQSITVFASMPKFKSEYNVEMSEVLKEMGMPEAFDGNKADFTGLGTSTEGNIFINRVLHKTFIEVNETGTKAGAATVVEMTDECAMEIIDYKTVNLDRPFVYMLIDCEKNAPFFMGTIVNME